MAEWPIATGVTVLEGKRRVEGIEFEAAGSITPQLGSSTAASHSWTARSSTARRGHRQAPARRRRDRGQRVDGLSPRRRLGNRRRRARAERHRAHGCEPARRDRSRATSCSMRLRLTCRSSTRSGSTSTTSPTRRYYIGGYKNSAQSRAARHAARGYGDAALQLHDRCCCTIPKVLTAEQVAALPRDASTPRAGSTAT